jgi:hypothetical protein
MSKVSSLQDACDWFMTHDEPLVCAHNGEERRCHNIDEARALYAGMHKGEAIWMRCFTQAALLWSAILAVGLALAEIKTDKTLAAVLAAGSLVVLFYREWIQHRDT